jgi:hypothetical protein
MSRLAMPFVLMALGASLWAQDPGPAPGYGASQLEAARQEVESEEMILMRERFFSDRRRKPGDPNFDAAAARERAIAARDLQARTAPLELPQTGTVWQGMGPAPITGGQTPQDFQQASPVSGRVSAIAIDPVDFRVYAGGAQGGVWRTDDNGDTWVPLTDTLGSLATGCIAIDPSDHNVVYYGTGEGNFTTDSYAGVGVYKSTDRGDTWAGPLGNVEFHSRSVASMVVDRTSSNVVLALSSSGACGESSNPACPPPFPPRGPHKSTDGGLTWTKKPSPPGMANDVRGSILLQDPLVSTRWYAAMVNVDTVSGGLWLSTDTGETWASLNGVGGAPTLAIPSPNGFNRYWLTATADPGDTQSTLYLGTGHNNASGQRGGRIYKSTDSGATWTQLPAADDYCMAQCSYDLPIYVEPGNKNVIYHGGAGAVDTAGTTKGSLRRSTDGGATFTDIIRSIPTATAVHSDSHAIVAQPASGNILWAGNDGGIWRSTDRGTTWQDRNTNLAITQFVAVDLDLQSPTNQAYAGTQDNGTNGWTGSTSWPHLDFGDGGFNAIDQGNPNNLVHTYFNITNVLIAVGCTTGGFGTTQGNYNVSRAPNNGIPLNDRVLFYPPIQLDHGSGAATQTLYFATHRLWRAPSFFGSPCLTGVGGFTSLMGATDLLGTGAFSAIETKASPTPDANADVICLGSSTGRVFCTTDANAGTPTWTERDTALATKPYISGVVIDPAVAFVPGVSGTVWVARSGFFGTVTGNQVRKSTDGGVTWSTSGFGIPDIPVNAIALDRAVPGRLWAGTDIGIYVSADGGVNWSVYGTGLPNAAVFDLKTSPLPAGQGAIVAVTYGRGAFRLAPLTPAGLLDFRVE